MMGIIFSLRATCNACVCMFVCMRWKCVYAKCEFWMCDSWLLIWQLYAICRIAFISLYIFYTLYISIYLETMLMCKQPKWKWKEHKKFYISLSIYFPLISMNSLSTHIKLWRTYCNDWQNLGYSEWFKCNRDRNRKNWTEEERKKVMFDRRNWLTETDKAWTREEREIENERRLNS